MKLKKLYLTSFKKHSIKGGLQNHLPKCQGDGFLNINRVFFTVDFNTCESNTAGTKNRDH